MLSNFLWSIKSTLVLCTIHKIINFCLSLVQFLLGGGGLAGAADLLGGGGD